MEKSQSVQTTTTSRFSLTDAEIEIILYNHLKLSTNGCDLSCDFDVSQGFLKGVTVTQTVTTHT